MKEHDGKRKTLGYIPGVTSGRKDPTECRSCLRKEPDIELVLPRLCRECQNRMERERKARRKKENRE